MNLPDHRKILAILLIFYMVGIVLLSVAATKLYIERLTPYTLLMNIVLIIIFHKPWTASHIVIYLLIAISGFLVEVAGVYTGLIFGDYQYGHVLGIKLFDSPLIIGVNWLMLTYFIYHIMLKSKWPAWLQITGGALLMVIYDIILEPVAIRMNMWSWSGGVIPFQNYAAWFIISVIFFSLLHAFNIRQQNRIANGLFAIQAGFILSLNIIYRFI
ncbi:MAG: carotenoid biosynthesis protein [Bacteroidales bacterium]